VTGKTLYSILHRIMDLTDFESITYKDLYGAAKLSSENISLKNYIENTYLYNYINKYLKVK